MLNADDRFCAGCGQSVQETTPAPVPTPVPAPAPVPVPAPVSANNAELTKPQKKMKRNLILSKWASRFAAVICVFAIIACFPIIAEMINLSFPRPLSKASEDSISTLNYYTGKIYLALGECQGYYVVVLPGDNPATDLSDTSGMEIAFIEKESCSQEMKKALKTSGKVDAPKTLFRVTTPDKANIFKAFAKYNSVPDGALRNTMPADEKPSIQGFNDLMDVVRNAAEPLSNLSDDQFTNIVLHETEPIHITNILLVAGLIPVLLVIMICFLVSSSSYKKMLINGAYMSAKKRKPMSKVVWIVLIVGLLITFGCIGGIAIYDSLK
jgi:hypothetical protein